jgi:cell filamentation protein
MYDAIEDPYTYENSTVLVNKLDLREQTELDAFEVEISSARAEEPLPHGTLDFIHYKAVHHHLFQDVYQWAGQVRTVRISKGGNPFCFPENIEDKRTSCSTICKPLTIYKTSTLKRSHARPRIFWQN